MPIIRQIAQLGQPVLRQKAEEISIADIPNQQALSLDMLATLKDANGVGLAAPQVYESKQIIIVASKPNARYPNAPKIEPITCLNPTITQASAEMEVGWEGCLSIPGIRGLVPRSKRIQVSWLSLEGKEQQAEFVDFVARVFQHEIDHLQGLVFLDRLTSSHEIVTEKEYLRLMAGQ